MDDDDNLFEILGVEEPRPDAGTPRVTVSNHGEPHPPPLGARLREHLHARFPLTDRRYKPAPGTPFKIDDRGRDGDSMTVTWSVLARVPDTDDGLFLLILENTPYDDKTEELVTGAGGRKLLRSKRADYYLPVRPTKKGVAMLRRLARAVRGVVGIGRTYTDPNWKWLAGRTAAALKALAAHLTAFRPDAPPRPAGSGPLTPKPSPTPRATTKPSTPAADKKPPR